MYSTCIPCISGLWRLDTSIYLYLSVFTWHPPDTSAIHTRYTQDTIHNTSLPIHTRYIWNTYVFHVSRPPSRRYVMEYVRYAYPRSACSDTRQRRVDTLRYASDTLQGRVFTAANLHSVALLPKAECSLLLLVARVRLALRDLRQSLGRCLLRPLLLLVCPLADWHQLIAHVELRQDMVDGEYVGADARVLEALARRAVELGAPATVRASQLFRKGYGSIPSIP